jgi:hypothetical protein
MMRQATKEAIFCLALVFAWLAVREEGNGEFLRCAFVARAGHCAFTPAETIAAALTLLRRLATGKWDRVDASDLNTSGASLRPLLNIFPDATGALVPVQPAFVDFKPGPYLRPFDSLSEECASGQLSACFEQKTGV